MSRRVLVLAVLAAQLLVLAVAVPAAAAPARVSVSGRVRGGGGMSVLALAPDGSARSVRLGASGRFSLSVPRSSAPGTTLQLVRASGRYAGPVVLAARGARSYTLLGGKPVRLGDVSLRSGYARVLTTRLPKGAVLTTRWARGGTGGRPVGAGRLGLVARAGSAGARLRDLGRAQVLDAGASRSDPDSDGIPSAFDADDDGDLTLDGSDPSATSGAGLFTSLHTDFADTLNANAGDEVTQEQIDALLEGEHHFGLIFYFDARRFGEATTVTSANVDCFQLAYCRRDTGTAVLSGLSESSEDLPRGTPWVEYSPDGSGLPNLEHLTWRGAFAAGVQPQVPSAQITPGDTYNVNFRTNRGTITVPASLSAYFVTTPAISRWSAGGDPVDVAYPATVDAQGTYGNPIQSEDGGLTLGVWRPQRLAIAGAEPGRLRDMGGLRYGLSVSVRGRSMPHTGCGGHYQDLSSTLEETYVADPERDEESERVARLSSLRDSAADAAPDPASTLSFTVDLASCLSSVGVDPSGATVDVTLSASGESREGGTDSASQTFAVQLGEMP